MDIIATPLSLDFNTNDSLKTVCIQQGDNGGRVINVKLYNGGERVSISSGSGDSALLLASINGIVTALGTPLSITNNMVNIPITSALSSIAGREHCEIRLYTTNGTVHTAEFDLLVGKAAADSSMPHVIETADIIDDINDIQNALGGLSLRRMTQTAYQNITPNSNTVYFVTNNGSVKLYLGDIEISGGGSSPALGGIAVGQLSGSANSVGGAATPITE